jgi:hypothetical protein
VAYRGLDIETAHSLIRTDCPGLSKLRLLGGSHARDWHFFNELSPKSEIAASRDVGYGGEKKPRYLAVQIRNELHAIGWNYVAGVCN